LIASEHDQVELVQLLIEKGDLVNEEVMNKKRARWSMKVHFLFVFSQH
jgi:hypothetical protein